MKHNWAVFISGTGSNLSALLDLETSLNVNLVVTNKRNAYGVSRARRRGIPVYFFENNDWDGLQSTLEKYNIDFIFLAGFMKIVPETFLRNWSDKIFNIHPSLLPAYPGLNSIERAFKDGAPVGATIHRVTPAVDQGQIILQKKSKSGFNLESTSLNVHIIEHQLVRKAFQWLKKSI